MKGNKMNYMKVETVSLVNFASILMDGIVKYKTICYNSHVCLNPRFDGAFLNYNGNLLFNQTNAS